MEHGGGVLAVALSPDGVQLATGSYDEAARLWEASSGSELARMEHGSPVLAVALTSTASSSSLVAVTRRPDCGL